jgi:hypothetical protein
VLCISFTLIHIFTLDFPWLDLSEIALLKFMRLPLQCCHQWPQAPCTSWVLCGLSVGGRELAGGSMSVSGCWGGE